MIDASAGDNRNVARGVVSIMIAMHLVGIEGGNGIGRAEHGASERVMWIHRLGEQVIDVILGRILATGNFLEHDLTLRDYVLVGKSRIDEHVRENLETKFEALVNETRVKARELAGSEGVELGTQCIKRRGDVEPRCVSLCP